MVESELDFWVCKNQKVKDDLNLWPPLAGGKWESENLTWPEIYSYLSLLECTNQWGPTRFWPGGNTPQRFSTSRKVDSGWCCDVFEDVTAAFIGLEQIFTPSPLPPLNQTSDPLQQNYKRKTQFALKTPSRPAGKTELSNFCNISLYTNTVSIYICITTISLYI